jgi:hypothetical protein
MEARRFLGSVKRLTAKEEGSWLSFVKPGVFSG